MLRLMLVVMLVTYLGMVGVFVQLGVHNSEDIILFLFLFLFMAFPPPILHKKEKNKVKLSAGLPFGYESSEALYLSEKDIQDQKSDLKNSALDIPLQDTKETFQIMLGREKRGGEGEGGEKEHALWPVRPEGLAGAWRGYYRLVERVGDVVLRCVAYSLGKRGEGVKGRRGVDFFDDYTKDHRSSLRGLFYLEEEGEGERRGEEGEEIVRCGAHSDWGLMTLLRQAPSRGSSILQVMQLLFYYFIIVFSLL